MVRCFSVTDTQKYFWRQNRELRRPNQQVQIPSLAASVTNDGFWVFEQSGRSVAADDHQVEKPDISQALRRDSGIGELVRRRFMKMSEIRHNLVHRMGIIDSNLAAACPWLKMTVGHRIHLNDEVLNNYSMAIRRLYHQRMGARRSADNQFGTDHCIGAYIARRML
jgi:hypothetical protein